MASGDLIDQFMRNYYVEHYKKTAKIVQQICEEGLDDISRKSGRKIEAVLSHRAKSEESLRKKIEKLVDQKRHRNERQFESEADIDAEIWDRAGVRIVLYFPNQGEEVTQMIKEKFGTSIRETSHPVLPADAHVVPSRNVQASSNYQTVFPGYMAKHFRVELTKEAAYKMDHRIQWSEDKNHWVEIQVQSLLVHAWAQVHHDIKYKGIGTSQAEEGVLDCLRGLFMGGEILLDVLQVTYERRVASDRGTFLNKYALMDYLCQQLENPTLEDGPIQMLWKFLHVFEKNSRSEIASTLGDIYRPSQSRIIKTGGETPTNVVDSRVSKYGCNVREDHRMNLPIRIMDQILDKTPTRIKEELRAKANCQGNVEPAVKCKVILSSYIWLKEFRESPLSVRLFKDQNIPSTSEYLWMFKWPLEGPDRILILNGKSEAAGESSMKALDFLWNWFKDQKDSIYSFVFSISQLGVLKDLPDNIGLLHTDSCSIAVLSEDGSD
ncbi:MAG: hypothetical protein M1821_005126 [Bathelium mastoideum]|nr:MAG: hypothetical protein M1821_005126 [Bathelium mastoideum]